MNEAFRLFTPLPEILRKTVADLWLPKSVAAILAGLLDYFFPEKAGRDLAIAAASLIALDTVTGFWASLVSGRRVSSAKFSRVLTKLMGYGSVVVVCGVAAHAVPGAVALQPMAVSGVLGFVTLTEGISILENVGRMGVKAPPFLLEWLRKRLREPREGFDTSPGDPS